MSSLPEDLNDKKINNKPFQRFCQEIAQRLLKKGTAYNGKEASRQKERNRPIDWA